jgi:hypothetical protein
MGIVLKHSQTISRFLSLLVDFSRFFALKHFHEVLGFLSTFTLKACRFFNILSIDLELDFETQQVFS